MKIAYNPESANALTAAPSNNDITFDLAGKAIYAKGVKFEGMNTTYSVFKKHTSDNSGGYDGLVPVPSYTTTTTRYLREDGTWVVPTNYHRPISVNGTSILENDNTALNLVAGANISIIAENSSGYTGKVTITNTGVRSTTINGNYLRIDTNGTNTDLTIPYASTAALLAKQGGTDTSTSVWNPQTSWTKVWGQSFTDSSISSDTGDILYYLRAGEYSSENTELCVAIDGDYYAGTGQYKVWHAGNLTKVSQLDNDSGFLTSLPSHTHSYLTAYGEGDLAATRTADYTIALCTGGWASTSAGYGSLYGTTLDVSGYSTWYHRLAFRTDGRIEYWQGINTKTMSSLGILAFTSDIPTVTNYYWANIQISDSSNPNTYPIFGAATARYYNFTGSDGSSFGYIGRGGSTDAVTCGTYGKQFMNFMTNSKTRIHISSDGDVGIGTESPAQKLSVDGAIYTILSSTNRRAGIIGTYDPNRAAAIWSMGSSYQIAEDGTTFGNLYGAAYAYYGSGYTFDGGKSYGHSFVWCQNGTPYVALGDNIWTSGNVETGSFLTFGYHGAIFASDIRSSWRTSIYETETYGSRLRTVRTDVSIDDFSEIYGSGLTWATGDTHGYLSVSYHSGQAWIGGGNGNALNWSTYLVTGKNIGSQSVNYANSAGSATTANMISHSTYYYSGNVMKNSTSSDTIFGTTATANYLFPSFMESHPIFNNYADVINFTGYCKWGGTLLATEYNAINPRVAIRKYNQSRSNWGDWTEFITEKNNYKVRDSGNSNEITFHYSSGGFSSTPSWLAAWNGYDITYVAPSVLSVNYATSAGNADKLDNIDSTGFLRQVVVPNNTENDFNTFSNMTLTGRIDPTTGASLKNAPWSGSGPAGGYGVLTYLFSGSYYGTQMAWEYHSNKIYIRNRYWGSSGVTWDTTWDSLALTSDLANYMKATKVGSYYGLTTPTGSDSDWIRTTSNGLIPYEAGGITNGHCSIGTSGWYFNSAYITTVNCNTVESSANLLVNGKNSIQLKTNDDKSAVVLNTTLFKPFDTANNKLTLGSNTARWANTYSVLGNFSGQITSSVATGTSPFSITSTTKNTNLNADMLDGYHIWVGTQSLYNSAIKNNSTIYLIYL